MDFDVSKTAANAVLYSVLVTFTILAIGTAGYLNFLPSSITRCCVLDEGNKDATTGADYFLAARNSAGMWSIALSFFASGMGAWVLYGTTEMGATPELSWLGVIGYSSASAFPAILIGYWLGPMVRNRSQNAFSTTDFGRKRYGRVMQLAIAAVSGFYMFIYIVAELTSISTVYQLLTANYEKKYQIGVTVALGVFTILYTSIGGLPASIVTDKFQGVLMGVLVIVLLLAVTTESENHVNKSEFDRASNWTGQGAKAALTLIIAIASAELFNQSTWQRVWAAKDDQTMRRGFLVGSLMVFFLMMFFGVMGMIAYANDPEAYDNFEKFAFLSFFDLLSPLKEGWHIVTLVLVTALAASSVDSLQNGLASVFSRDILKVGWNPTWITRLFIVAINIPAIKMASDQYDVISLFLVADLVCATSVFPVFLGLQTEDWGILKAPTELGAFLGCIFGIVTVLVTGVIVGADGNIFEYFWLRNEGICALCGNETLITFIVTPSVSFVATYACSYLDLLIRGERARRPIFMVAFDKEDAESERSSYADSEEDNLEVPHKDVEQKEDLEDVVDT
mmetsp:Transcript_5636/g.11661  ORF Transcript_5636/g.11661 Transcript_5636/m.11661 type:complete len:565 (-) Transcript_5636:381-2075(-)|eukprot:CAMPEP_0168747682 /NCGR_PEP_ID=MMETSP0724-20121128/15784_1 /TAXON_ID=265536 /ORGANISM="Amphiprora sp., Strain CCMP467" /LENGTH=564 /DNA_ID=CAMNT_0008795483 /DNA_START=40 /DNA_END=1734 /DNA_ORIENTATION=-